MDNRYIFTIEAEHITSCIWAKFEVPAHSAFEAKAILKATLADEDRTTFEDGWNVATISKRIPELVQF